MFRSCLRYTPNYRFGVPTEVRGQVNWRINRAPRKIPPIPRQRVLTNYGGRGGSHDGRVKSDVVCAHALRAFEWGNLRFGTIRGMGKGNGIMWFVSRLMACDNPSPRRIDGYRCRGWRRSWSEASRLKQRGEAHGTVMITRWGK